MALHRDQRVEWDERYGFFVEESRGNTVAWSNPGDPTSWADDGAFVTRVWVDDQRQAVISDAVRWRDTHLQSFNLAPGEDIRNQIRPLPYRDPSPTMREIYEDLRLVEERIARSVGIRWTDYGPPSGGDESIHKEAEQKSLTLLKDWLSPSQLAQFEAYDLFTVVGSDTGKHYQIRRGTSINIDELDQGVKVRSWCFVPEGNLAVGDVMLAQKIALENNENETLKSAKEFPLRELRGMNANMVITDDPFAA